MKKLISCLAVLSLALPCAFAQDLPDNPAGSTVDVIAQEDVMENNDGTVTTNDGSIWTNNGCVTTNNGAVGENSESGSVDNVGEDGFVDYNYGSVDNNAGTVYTNESVINGNYGTVDDNTDTGTILVNSENATVGSNEGIIQQNRGNVTWNGSDGLIMINSGIVDDNEGMVDTCRGTVCDNAESGTVILSEGGKVEYNRGTVENAATVSGEEGGESLTYGDYTYYGMTYSNVQEYEGLTMTIRATEQWSPDVDAIYLVRSYDEVEEVIGSLPDHTRFTGWVDENGTIYLAGDTYDTEAPFSVRAMWEMVYQLYAVAANEDGSLSVCGAAVENFLRVKVDGEEVDPACYTLTREKVNITRVAFTDEYLATLADGEHVIRMCFTGGYAEYTFTK